MKEAAIGIIFSPDKKEVLLIKRRDVPIWVLPGGGIEHGETAECACLREVIEETGVQSEIVRKIGLWLPINRLSSPAHVFECEALDDKSVLLPQQESQEVAFWPLSALPATTFFLHRNWIATALKNSPYPIVATMHELTYWKALSLLLKHPLLTLRYLLSRLGCPINS